MKPKSFNLNIHYYLTKISSIVFLISCLLVGSLRSQSTLFTIRSTTPTITQDQQKIVDYYANSDHRGSLLYLDLNRSAINDTSLQIQFIITGVNSGQNLIFAINDVIYADMNRFSIRAEGQFGFLDLYITPDGLGGEIDLVNSHFDIVPLSNTLGILVERNLQSTNTTFCGNESQTLSMEQDFCEGECSNSIVDALILVTPEANTWLNNNLGTLADWFLFINSHNINQAFTNSLIPNKFVRFAIINFTPTFQWSTNQFANLRIDQDLISISNDQTAHNLMISAGADAVILLTNNNYTGPISTGGTAIIYGKANSLDPLSSNKFSIVQIPTMDPSRYTLAHELSHHFGCMHSIVDPPIVGCPHGTNMANGRNTIMANNAPDFSRIPNFSNPDVTFGGNATGVVDLRDNAQQIRAAFCETANNAPDHFSVSFTPTNQNLCPFFHTTGITFTSSVVQGYCTPYPSYFPSNCGMPPYQYEWRLSKTSEFTTSVVVATTANFSASMTGLYCPFFFLRLTVTSSDNQVTSFTKLYNTVQCFGCHFWYGGFASTDDNSDAFPNPATNEVILPVDKTSLPIDFECYDLTGKRLYLEYQFDRNLSRFVINTESLLSGLYLMKVNTGNMSKIVKIVIQ